MKTFFIKCIGAMILHSILIALFGPIGVTVLICSILGVGLGNIAAKNQVEVAAKHTQNNSREKLTQVKPNQYVITRSK